MFGFAFPVRTSASRTRDFGPSSVDGPESLFGISRRSTPEILPVCVWADGAMKRAETAIKTMLKMSNGVLMEISFFRGALACSIKTLRLKTYIWPNRRQESVLSRNNEFLPWDLVSAGAASGSTVTFIISCAPSSNAQPPKETSKEFPVLTIVYNEELGLF